MLKKLLVSFLFVLFIADQAYSTVLDTITIDPCQSSPCFSNIILEYGTVYLLEVSGTFSIDTAQIQDTDAEWLFPSGSEPQEYSNDPTLGENVGDLMVGDGFVDWLGCVDTEITSYSVFSAHVY
ncbi:MAG: hypothetical protein ACWGMZ_11510 [Thermoguttaceae bacterium]